MDEQKSGMSVNWSEISDTINKNIEFLITLIGIIKIFRHSVEMSDFDDKEHFINRIDESTRDLLVVKSRMFLFASKKCISGPMSEEWRLGRDDLVLCVNYAAEKFNKICVEALIRLNEEANRREDDDFSD